MQHPTIKNSLPRGKQKKGSAASSAKKAVETKATDVNVVAQIQDYLDSAGEYRLNICLNRLDIKWKEGMVPETLTDVKAGCWVALTNQDVNDLWRRMRLSGLKVKLNEVQNILGSRFVPEYNPLVEYINSLPEWDGHDYIRDIVDGIVLKEDTPENRDYLYWTLKKWLVNMVGSWTKYEHVNDYIFMFIGGQGTFKTTFFNNLLPKELREYFLGRFSLDNINKDGYISLGESALINIDDISSIPSSKIGKIKNLTSLNYIKERRPYAPNAERIPRTASFVATSNVANILNDLTGEERRWLVHEIKSMTSLLTSPPNYQGLYSQTFALFKADSSNYLFSPEEVKAVNEHNKNFRTVSSEEEQILTYFSMPSAGEIANVYTSSDIASYIAIHSKLNIPANRIGMAMNRLGFEKGRKNDCKGYRVHVKTPEEQEADFKKEALAEYEAKLAAKEEKKPIEQVLPIAETDDPDADKPF
ncbi:MAG: virulence-associated E family protein [Bacteroidaceae bacterium]|nr:virulence-associated E family protein [Bacteroidaceae bacterium]